MGFARKGTTAVTPMTSLLVSLPWCAGIISEDAVLMAIVAGKEMLLSLVCIERGNSILRFLYRKLWGSRCKSEQIKT